jgi:RNA polymerase sigma factor (TIGR02999 family)
VDVFSVSMGTTAPSILGVAHLQIVLALLSDFSGYYPAMSDVTRIMSQIEAGDSRAAEDLLPLVYDELRKLAAAKMSSERSDHTLQATALVHEAYLRMVNEVARRHWKGRRHFMAAAAIAMRQILVDWARKKGAVKRGGNRVRLDLDDVNVMNEPRPADVLALEEAMQKLAATDPESAQVAELRLFAGLSLKDIAKSLGIGRSTAHRRWLYARAAIDDALTSEL